jgi:hypothetical protein
VVGRVVTSPADGGVEATRGRLLVVGSRPHEAASRRWSRGRTGPPHGGGVEAKPGHHPFGEPKRGAKCGPPRVGGEARGCHAVEKARWWAASSRHRPGEVSHPEISNFRM